MTRPKRRELSPLPFTPRLVISAEEHEESLLAGEAAVSTFREFAKVPPKMRARSPEMDRFCSERFEKGQTWNALGALHSMSDDVAWSWLSPVCKIKIDGPRYVIARFGERAIPCALTTGDVSPHAWQWLVEHVECVETATMVAQLFAGSTRSKHAAERHRMAHAWFEKRPSLGAIALVPMALSKSAKARTLGARGLVGLAEKHLPTVLSIASSYGEDVRDAVADIVAT